MSFSWLKFKYLIVLICLILAYFFIFDHIGARALWTDEALIANSLSVPFDGFYQEAVDSQHLLFYFFSLKSWSLIFNDSEFALRGFSALFGLLIILVIFFVAKDIFKSRKVAWLACFLASVNYFLIWFSTQARPYTLAAFLGLVSFWFFIKLIRDFKKPFFFFYILFTVLGIYTHPWLSLIFVSQVLTLILFYKKDLKIFLGQLIILILSIPNFLILLTLSQSNSTNWIGQVGINDLLSSFKYFTFGSSWLYLIFGLITLIFVLSKQKKISSERKLINSALYLYLFFPLVSAFLISQFKLIYVVARYEMVLLPAFLLIVAYWFSQVKSKYFFYFLIPLFLIFTFKSVIDDRAYVNKFETNDRLTAQELILEIKENDVVIATDLSWTVFKYYFDHLTDREIDLISFPQEIMQEHPGWINREEMINQKEEYFGQAEDLVKRLKQKNISSVWLLYRENNMIYEFLYQKLNQEFQLREVRPSPVFKQQSWVDLILVFDN